MALCNYRSGTAGCHVRIGTGTQGNCRVCGGNGKCTRRTGGAKGRAKAAKYRTNDW